MTQKKAGPIKIKRVLIANRGEIAVRITNTLKELGIETVALRTDEECGLPHTLVANACINLGKGTLRETYLNKNKIIEIAKSQNVDAIHPGYGLLSENAEFAAMVEKAGLKFIGPRSESIKAMGDKISSKERCLRLGIPLIPGIQNPESMKPNEVFQKAIEMGPPLLVKASAGGGGKGMRIFRPELGEDRAVSQNRFFEVYGEAKREAMAAFGDDRVMIEKYIENPRHIEIQVFGDQHKQYRHLYERECSIQRRYQKIVEESPSPFMTTELREKMTSDALKICDDIQYEGAGTIEFIVSPEGKYYFLEMNTRLQVEHPVTELVTGLDLVALQILVAEGHPLPFKQSELIQRGHALEVRLCAEDPDQNFMPATGKILQVMNSSLGPNARLDTGYIDGAEVTVSFDSMLAKLVVFAESRPRAIQRMVESLKKVPFLGVKNNRDYLMRIMKTSAFHKGETYTNFVNINQKELGIPEVNQATKDLLAVGMQFFRYRGKSQNNYSGKAGGSGPTVFDLLTGKKIN